MGFDPFRQPASDRMRPPSDAPPSSEPVSSTRPEHALIDATAIDTALIQKNFTIAMEDRMRAVVNGPPAYMRRRRDMEDLEASIRGSLRAAREGRVRDTDLLRMRLEKQVARLNTLIDLHNRYYPMEANLPIDPTTGALLDNGDPWEPAPHVTLEGMRESVGVR